VDVWPHGGSSGGTQLFRRGRSAPDRLTRPEKPCRPWKDAWFPRNLLDANQRHRQQLAKQLNERHQEVVSTLPKTFPIGADGKR
jgi:hypothetical protein